MDIIDKIRKNKYISIPFFGLTRNAAYKEQYRFIEESSNWDKEQMDEWQFERVREVVAYAMKHVPFYKALYAKQGFEIGDLKSWDIFKSLPTVSKKDIKENPLLFETDELMKLNSRVDYTGGSLGTPMSFRIDESMYYREDAYYRWYWEKTGFRTGQRCVVLRGKKVANVERKQFHEYNRFWNYMYLDSSYISMDYIEEYDDAIRKFGARNIQAYPSSILLLAKVYQASGRKVPKFDNIYLGSENVTKEQIQFLREIFGGKGIYNQYGHSEKIVLALQELEGEKLGFIPQYGYAEILNDKGKDAEAGELGEITGTSFARSMPFIRYRTEDGAVASDVIASGVSKNWKMIESLEGRLHEMIVTEDGRKVSVCTVGGAHIQELNAVLDMQYEQYEKGKLLVKVVENRNLRLTESDKNAIERKYEEIFENKISCVVECVEAIGRTQRNKKKMLIQHLDIE